MNCKILNAFVDWCIDSKLFFISLKIQVVFCRSAVHKLYFTVTFPAQNYKTNALYSIF